MCGGRSIVTRRRVHACETSQMTDMPPPGWYPDSTSPGMVRWWNGWSWSGGPVAPETAFALPTGLRDIGPLVADTWEPIGRRARDIAALALAVLAPVALVVGPVVWLTLRDIRIVEVGEQVTFNPAPTQTTQYEIVGATALDWVSLAIVGLVLALAAGLFWLAAARLLLGEHQGVHLAWGSALRQGLDRFLSTLGTVLVLVGLSLAAVLGIFIVLIGLAGAGGALVAFLVVFGVGVYFWTRLHMAPLVAVIAPRGVRPIAATWERVGGSIIGVFGRVFVLSLISSVATYAVGIPVGLLQGALPFAGFIAVTMCLQITAQVLATVYLVSGQILIWGDLGGEMDQIVPDAPGGTGPVIGGPIAR